MLCDPTVRMLRVRLQTQLARAILLLVVLSAVLAQEAELFGGQAALHRTTTTPVSVHHWR
jgi:hypothetical protein